MTAASWVRVSVAPVMSEQAVLTAADADHRHLCRRLAHGRHAVPDPARRSGGAARTLECQHLDRNTGGRAAWHQCDAVVLVRDTAEFLLMVTAIALHSLLRDGGWLRERIDRLRSPSVKRGALGSSHFCTLREYRRFRRSDPDGLTLLGAFWGENKRRLDMRRGTFLSGRGGCGARHPDARRTRFSGKTQGIILPAIADRMLAGHSLVVADPQGEITAHVLKYAAVTRHLVVVHDPTSSAGPRYNLAEGIDNVSDARAIADVLVPSAQATTVSGPTAPRRCWPPA